MGSDNIDKVIEWYLKEVEITETKITPKSLDEKVIEWYLEEAGIGHPKLIHVDPNLVHFSEKFDGPKRDRLYKRAKDFLKMKKRGETIPPIVVYENSDGSHEIHDGHARVVAFRRMGIRDVPAVAIPKNGNPAASSVPSSSSAFGSSSSSSSSDSSSSGSSKSSKSSEPSSMKVVAKPSSSSSSSSSSDSSKSSESSKSSNSSDISDSTHDSSRWDGSSKSSKPSSSSEPSY
jgi:hypothetical protein